MSATPRNRPRPTRGSPLLRQQYRLPSSSRARAARLRSLLIVGAVILALAAGWSVLRRTQADPAAPGPASPASTASDTPDVAAGGASDGVKIATFLGGALRRSYGIGPAPTHLELVWRTRLGSGQTRRKSDNKLVWWAGSGWTGQCTVVRDKGRDYLLIGGFDHNLHKIDALTGKVVWQYPFDDVIKSTNTVFENPRPTSDADRIIVVAGSRRGSDLRVGDKRIAPLRAVSFTTGRELWRFPVPRTMNYSQDVDSSPLLYKGVLYAAVESGYVYALDPFRTKAVGGHRQPIVLGRSPRLFTDADARSHPDLDRANVAIEASPTRIGDVLYIASGSGHLYGLKLPSLKIVWDFRTRTDIDGTTVAGRDGTMLQSIEKQYVSAPGGVYGLDPSVRPATSPLWYFPTPDSSFGEWKGGVVGSVAINDESDPKGRHPRLAAFISIDGSLRVIARDGLSSDTVRGPGASAATRVPVEVFSDRIGSGISTPIIVGDSLIAAGYDRKVHLYRITYTSVSTDSPGALRSPDGRSWRVGVKQVSSYTAGSGFESTPIVWNERVYIGCRDGYLYCLGER